MVLEFLTAYHIQNNVIAKIQSKIAKNPNILIYICKMKDTMDIENFSATTYELC